MKNSRHKRDTDLPFIPHNRWHKREQRETITIHSHVWLNDQQAPTTKSIGFAIQWAILRIFFFCYFFFPLERKGKGEILTFLSGQDGTCQLSHICYSLLGEWMSQQRYPILIGIRETKLYLHLLQVFCLSWELSWPKNIITGEQHTYL